MIDWLTSTAIFFGAVPMILGMLTLKKLKFSKGLFALLFIGFAADLFNLFSRDLQIDRQVVWHGYSIIECAILLWIVEYRKNLLTLKSFLLALAFVTLPLWSICQYFYDGSILFEKLGISSLSLFIIIYQVYILFRAAAEVLKLGEQEEDLTAAPAFWIFTAIFFYAIGTFFIMSFLSKPIILYKMYYINNLVNIVTHLLYSIGFTLSFFGSTSSMAPSREQ